MCLLGILFRQKISGNPTIYSHMTTTTGFVGFRFTCRVRGRCCYCYCEVSLPSTNLTACLFIAHGLHDCLLVVVIVFAVVILSVWCFLVSQISVLFYWISSAAAAISVSKFVVVTIHCSGNVFAVVVVLLAFITFTCLPKQASKQKM